MADSCDAQLRLHCVPRLNFSGRCPPVPGYDGTMTRSASPSSPTPNSRTRLKVGSSFRIFPAVNYAWVEKMSHELIVSQAAITALFYHLAGLRGFNVRLTVIGKSRAPSGNSGLNGPDRTADAKQSQKTHPTSVRRWHQVSNRAGGRSRGQGIAPSRSTTPQECTRRPRG